MFGGERRPVIWVSAFLVAVAGFGGMVSLPSISLAQYPGSAGELNTGAFGASSSATSASASSSSGVAGDGFSDGPAKELMAGSASSSEGSKGRNGYGLGIAASSMPKKSLRKRALIRQLRVEFAKILTIETVNQRPLRALSADVYLDQFAKELDTGLEQQGDVNSLGQDLGLVRNVLNDRLDEVISSYSGDIPRRGFLFKTVSAGGSARALRTEVQKLKLKHELLVFGEYSLQAMGYYAK